jgi:hypothetical protein
MQDSIRKRCRSKNTIKTVAISALSKNTSTCTVGSRRSSRSFLNMSTISATPSHLDRNAVPSLIDKIAILPERALRLQSAEMMQSVQNDSEDALLAGAGT